MFTLSFPIRCAGRVRGFAPRTKGWCLVVATDQARMQLAAGERTADAVSPAAALAGEFWRYLLVSAVALAVDFGVLIGLTELLGVHYLFAGAAGFLIGAGAVYAGSVFWVFAHRKLSRPDLEMTIFVLIGVGGLGVNELALWGLTEFAGLYVGVSKIGAAGCSFAFNFIVRKHFLFR